MLGIAAASAVAVALHRGVHTSEVSPLEVQWALVHPPLSSAIVYFENAMAATKSFPPEQLLGVLGLPPQNINNEWAPPFTNRSQAINYLRLVASRRPGANASAQLPFEVSSLVRFCVRLVACVTLNFQIGSMLLYCRSMLFHDRVGEWAGCAWVGGKRGHACIHINNCLRDSAATLNRARWLLHTHTDHCARARWLLHTHTDHCARARWLLHTHTDHCARARWLLHTHADHCARARWLLHTHADHCARARAVQRSQGPNPLRCLIWQALSQHSGPFLPTAW
jgi:hypothetical protein